MTTQTAVVVQDLEKSKAMALLSKAEAALAETVEIEPMLQLRGAAAGVEAMALALKSPELAEKAKIFQLKCERRAGSWLLDFGPDEGRPSKLGCVHPSFYTDLGITYRLRKIWQMMARKSDRDFEKWIRDLQSEGEEISQRAFLRYAAPAPEPKPHVAEKALSILDRLTDSIKATMAILHELGTIKSRSQLPERLAQARYALGLVDTMHNALTRLVKQLEKEVGEVQ